MKQLFILLLSTVLFLFSCTKDEGCSYSLDGTWIRLDDPSGAGTTGMKIQYANGTGKIIYAPSNSSGFYNGQIKWKQFNNTDCKIYDLIMPDNIYRYYDVHFNNENEFVIEVGTNGDIRYKRQ